MRPDDAAAARRLPKPRSTTAKVHAPLRVLSMTGGGYRGLFSAQVLVELCERARHPGRLDRAFDVFAGTSIGGLMACALAVGVPPRRVLDAIDAYGPRIFPPKRQRNLRRVLFGTLYDAGNLAKAIDDCLGKPNARTRLTEINVGLIVPAVDWVNGQTRVFMSAFLGKAHASDATLRDVCLATAAAPTYFDAHPIDGMPMLDGGMAANNPDVLALMEIARRWPQRFARTEMLSIGTAGADTVRKAGKANKSGVGWAPDVTNFMITVQESTAAAQAKRLLGDRYLRVNHVPTRNHPAFEHMDIANDDTRAALLDAGTATAKAAYKNHTAFIDRMLSDRRGG
jgi:predicted acylesterase/phospholipase RssA